MDIENKVIGFIGGGNMASAIVEGILIKGVVKSSQIMVSSPSESTLEKWKKSNIKAVHSNAQVIKESDIIFLSFKPYQLEKVFKDIKCQLPNNMESKLFVSILAGITSEIILKHIQEEVQSNPRIIRVMPNTPMMVCEGCSAISEHPSANKNDTEIIKLIFSALGKCEVVPENLISPVTGLTGSGPAYIYIIIEALSDGAVKQGLPRELATTFAAQMVLGSAKMVLESQKHTGQLKDEVCSAGGTTISAVHALEKGGLRATLMNAIEAAVLRATEIGSKQQK